MITKRASWLTDTTSAVILIRAHAFTGRKKIVFVTLLLGFLAVAAAHIWLFSPRFEGRSSSFNA